MNDWNDRDIIITHGVPVVPLAEQTCATCHYMRPYLTNNPSEGGECMHPAPVAAVVRDMVVTIRPHVMDTHYCGAWTAKDRQ